LKVGVVQFQSESAIKCYNLAKRSSAMSELAEKIFEGALQLPTSERADLAERLLDSLAFGTDERVDALWAAEAESRIAAFRRRELSAVPAEGVFAEIEAEAS
jgi:putative addiction module component (TIGR02574 family)